MAGLRIRSTSKQKSGQKRLSMATSPKSRCVNASVRGFSHDQDPWRTSGWSKSRSAAVFRSPACAIALGGALDRPHGPVGRRRGGGDIVSRSMDRGETGEVMMTKTDEDAIRDIELRFNEAWGRHDADDVV